MSPAAVVTSRNDWERAKGRRTRKEERKRNEDIVLQTGRKVDIQHSVLRGGRGRWCGTKGLYRDLGGVCIQRSFAKLVFALERRWSTVDAQHENKLKPPIRLESATLG